MRGSDSLRDSFRQRGHASHRCALRADSRVSNAPALLVAFKHVLCYIKELIPVEWRQPFQDYLVQSCMAHRLVGLEEDLQNCGYDVLRGLNPLLRNLSMTPLVAGCAVPARTQRDGGRRGVCPSLRRADSQIDYETRVTKKHGHRMSKSA